MACAQRLLPVLPCFKVGCTGVWVCVPLPEHPLGCHQRVPWGHSCHRLSPPAQPHRAGLPRGDRRCCRPVLVLPPGPAPCSRGSAWAPRVAAVAACLSPMSVPTCLSLHVCPPCLSPRLLPVSLPSACPPVSVPTSFPLRQSPRVSPAVSVSLCLSPSPRVYPPVPVPAASRWCQENGQRAEAAGGRCRAVWGIGAQECQGGLRGSPRAPSSVPPSPRRNPFCFFSQAARPNELPPVPFHPSSSTAVIVLRVNTVPKIPNAAGPAPARAGGSILRALCPRPARSIPAPGSTGRALGRGQHPEGRWQGLGVCPPPAGLSHGSRAASPP